MYIICISIIPRKREKVACSTLLRRNNNNALQLGPGAKSTDTTESLLTQCHQWMDAGLSRFKCFYPHITAPSVFNYPSVRLDLRNERQHVPRLATPARNTACVLPVGHIAWRQAERISSVDSLRIHTEECSCGRQFVSSSLCGD